MVLAGSQHVLAHRADPPPPPFLEARPAPWPKQDRTQAQTYYLREKEEEFLAKHGKLTKRQYKDKLKIRKEKWKLHWKHNMMPGDRKPHTDRFQAAKDDYEEKLKEWEAANPGAELPPAKKAKGSGNKARRRNPNGGEATHGDLLPTSTSSPKDDSRSPTFYDHSKQAGRSYEKMRNRDTELDAKYEEGLDVSAASLCRRFWTDELLEEIARCTNLYARRRLGEKYSSSRDVDKGDIAHFIAILMFMGYNKM